MLGVIFFFQITIFRVFWTLLCFGGPRQFEHGLGQAFANLVGRGAFGSSVVPESVHSPENG